MPLAAWLNTRGVLSTKLFLKARQAIISFLLRTGGEAKLVNCFWHANETLVKRSGPSAGSAEYRAIYRPNPFAGGGAINK